MEQNPTLEPTKTQENQQVCINCGNPNILQGYPNALCEECREKFIKFPIPLWVKLFGGGICLLVAVLLFSLPKNLSAGVDYKRGLNAEKAKKYVTEQRLMENLVKKQPGYLDAKAHLLIAAFYNNDLATIGSMADRLQGEKFEDDELLNKINSLANEVKYYLPSDSLVHYAKQYTEQTGGIPDSIYWKIISGDESDLFTRVRFASVLINQKKYAEADSLLTYALDKKSSFFPAIELKISLLRLKNNTAECLEYCNRLLDINRESVFALCGIARTNFKTGKPDRGLDYTRQALAINPDDGYANATLVLAYHFNKMLKERDALIEKIKQGSDTTMKSYLEYPLDVINHKDSI
jgi:tetratricopeptide (TPR) repeat protein